MINNSEEVCCDVPDYRLLNTAIQNDGFDNFYRVYRYECTRCGNKRHIGKIIPEVGTDADKEKL